MRRLYILLIISATVCFTHASNVIHYWFDNSTVKQTLTGNSIDCSSLPTGIHYAHFQIEGDDGMLSPTRTKAFFVLNENYVHTADYKQVSYWFDNQTEKQKLTGNSIDCSSLSTGMHFAHFQLEMADGTLSPMRSKAFFVLNENCVHTADYKQVNYWFDNQTEKQKLTGNSVDCSSLSTGMHFAHFQIEMADGTFSPMCSKAFFVMNEEGVHSSEYDHVEYWFDNDVERNKLKGDALACDMLSDGLHAAHFQIFDKQKVAGPVRTQMFLVLSEAVASKLYYWFDDAEERYLADIDAAEIDISMLEDGEHTLHVMMADAKGHVLNAEERTAQFVIDGIDAIHAPAVENGKKQGIMYNLSGFRVPHGTKGIVIINGKKVKK